MGNEMGNSNTSELQEEENSITKVEGKSVQEACRVNGADLENHTVSVAEGKDYHQKENGLASDVPNGEADLHLANQASDETKEETEVQPPAESPKVEVKSNDGASDESSEIQQNSISVGSKDQDKPPANADVEAENQFVPVAEDKDYKEEEINCLPSDVPKEAEDTYAVEQITDGREQEEIRVHALAKSPKSEIESRSEGSDASDIHPTSPSKHLKDHEIPKKLELEENLQQISDHQFEKQTCSKKEEEAKRNSTSETISSSHDPEPLKFEDSKLDQSELYPFLDDPPIQERNGHIHEVILGVNLNFTTEENGHHVDTKISKDADETVVSGSNLEMEMSKDDLTAEEVTLEEEVFCEDRLEIKDGDDIGGKDFIEKPMIKSDLPRGEVIQCNAEIPNEIDPMSTGFPKAEPEVTSMEDSLNTNIEVSESTDKCAVLVAEAILMEKESEYGEDKAKHCPTQSCEESVKESNTGNANLSQSEFLMIELVEENNKKRIEDFTFYGSEGNMDCTEDRKVDENGHLADEHINDQIETSVECSKDSQKEAEETVKSEILLTESSLTDFEREEVSEERKIIEEIEEKTEASYGIGNNRAGGEQCMSTTLHVEQEVSLPTVQISFVQPQENRQNNEMHFKNIQSGNDIISELNQETCSDIVVTETSCFDSKIAETLISVAELAIEKHEQDLPKHTAKSMMAVAEFGTQENPLNEECEKVEMPYLASDDYQAQAQERIGRFSTESNPNNSNTQAQMQKSPSFGLYLRIEARTEESDRTPLLYQDKTAMEYFSTEADVSLGNPIAHTQSDQNTLQYQAMPDPLEERVVRMERIDSEKSKSPFLGFLKEEEEAHIIVTPQKHENNTTAKKANKETLNLHTKEVTSTSPKSKEKRKARTSLFTNCMCCTTVIN